MSILAAALLGLVQGISEFLPISSSGHLSVLQNFFGINTQEGESQLFFSVLLHLGTLVSVFIAYWEDIVGMVREAFGFFQDIRHPKPDDGEPKPVRRLVFMIIIATLPMLIIVPIWDAVEQLFYNTLFIGIAFIATGLILFLSDKIQNGRKTEKTMTFVDALIIGASQAIAVMPGLSRSGSTISTGMAVGLNRTFAVKFSFLLSIPAIMGANIITLTRALNEGIDTSLIPAFLIGTLVAMVSGYFAIRLTKLLAQKGKFGKFCYYCFTVGIITIVLTIVL